MSHTDFKFRIADFTGDRGSSIWYVGKSNTNFNISVSSLGRVWKLSFHPPACSGDGNDSQFGPTFSYRGKLEKLNLKDPYVKRWVRPATPDCGICVAAIQFPTDFLRGRGDVGNEEPDRLLTLTESGNAVEVQIIFSKKPIKIKNAFVIYTTYLKGTGDNIVLIARSVPFEPATINGIPKIVGGLPLDGAPLVGDKINGVNMLYFELHSNPNWPRLIETTGMNITRTS